MTKSRNKSAKGSKSKLFQIIVGLVIVAFVVLMLSDLFTSKPKLSIPISNTPQTVVYEFSKHGELSFQSEDGNFISSLDLEFADNEVERAQGLMFRTEMQEHQGMLFIFPSETRQSFYMKNTIISLDMIFINSNLEIVTIHKSTKPYDVNSYASTAPAQYVLETIAGYTDKFNINVGDKVVFRKTN